MSSGAADVPENLDIEGIGAAPSLDIEFLLHNYLLVVLNFDQHLRLEFSAASSAGDAGAAAPYVVGCAFETVFGGEALAAAADMASAALLGGGGQAEMSVP